MPGRRWIDARIRLTDIRLHCENIHLRPDGRDGWQIDIAELQEHITDSAHSDAFVIEGGYNADMGRTTTRRMLANLVQEFFDLTRIPPPATQTPTWRVWDEGDDWTRSGGWNEKGAKSDHAPVAATIDVTTRPPKTSDSTKGAAVGTSGHRCVLGTRARQPEPAKLRRGSRHGTGGHGAEPNPRRGCSTGCTARTPLVAQIETHSANTTRTEGDRAHTFGNATSVPAAVGRNARRQQLATTRIGTT